MLLLSASTFDFSVRSSSLGAGEDALDALFISFFPAISREGVEARTKRGKNAKQKQNEINH